MLIPQQNERGFSMITVVGSLIIISLLMVTALQLTQDHRRRATLSDEYALALYEAETALAAAECQIAIATGTPSRDDCDVTLSDARIAALDPVTLAGFIPGDCGQGATRGLCWPRQHESASALADLVKSDAYAVTLTPSDARGGRKTTPARYVIEPIPDALPSQWIQAGAPLMPSLFRITAVGFAAASVDAGGAKTDSQVNVMLQTVYRPRVDEP